MQQHFRRKRAGLLIGWLDNVATQLGRPITVLDVGGIPSQWHDRKKSCSLSRVICANIDPEAAREDIITADGTALPFADGSIDAVFSQSAIEHVAPGLQEKFFGEMCRVGRHVFLQTPNRYFPIEPHFCFPFFQHLPQAFRLFIAEHWKASWYYVLPNHGKEKACCDALTISLLSESMLRDFTRSDGAGREWSIHRETCMGLAKSFCMYSN